jgi:hypothetical protein
MLLKSYNIVQTSIEKSRKEEFTFTNGQRKLMTSRSKRDTFSYVSVTGKQAV